VKLRNKEAVIEFVVKTYPSVERKNDNRFYYYDHLVFVAYYGDLIFYTPMLAKDFCIICKQSCEVQTPVEESYLREKINKFIKNYQYCEKQIKHHREIKLLQEIKGDF